jgi:hypothetical protein
MKLWELVASQPGEIGQKTIQLSEKLLESKDTNEFFIKISMKKLLITFSFEISISKKLFMKQMEIGRPLDSNSQN